MKILAADDEGETRAILDKSLKDWGYEPVITKNGDEAWEILKQDDCPHIAILDWMMPGTDGIELCKKIRSKKKTDYVYIIFLTAKETSEDVITALEAGANSYVKKPVNLRELRSYINTGVMLINYIQGRKNFSEKLKNKIAALHDAMKLMKGSVTDLSSATFIVNETIQELSGSYEKFLNLLNEFIDTITNVSNRLGEMKTLSGQINIISINAGIESTRIKGSAGKGFAAVGNEIRQLALSLKDYTKSIETELAKIKSSQAGIFKNKENIHEKVEKTEELFGIQKTEFSNLDKKLQTLHEELNLLHKFSVEEDVKFGDNFGDLEKKQEAQTDKDGAIELF